MPTNEHAQVVCRLTQEAYDQLRLLGQESPETYLDPDVDWRQVLATRGVHEVTEDTDIMATQTVDLIPRESGAPNRADDQALRFYQSLPGLGPADATDERMWAWYTHFRYHAYSLWRWRRQRNTNLSNYVWGHWFVRNPPEGLWLYNTAARTWWIAHLATKAARASGGAFSAQEALGKL